MEEGFSPFETFIVIWGIAWVVHIKWLQNRHRLWGLDVLFGSADKAPARRALLSRSVFFLVSTTAIFYVGRFFGWTPA
ncbi:MAG: hypothetical protein V2I76_06330 [Roseobacter sp.]|nr:hypothetical protein [Roseobacter sp.]